MKRAKDGDKVKIHYTGRTANNEVFASSKGEAPVEFEIGSGTVLKGLERGVVGMAVGDTKTISIPAEEGFGARREDLVSTVPKINFPQNIDPSVGQTFELRLQDGNMIVAHVTGVEDDFVTLDANHPLAGRTLNFDVEILAIS